MNFLANTSPFAGKDGQFVTSRQLKERLDKELIHNVALRVEATDDTDRFRVSGRGELHLGILIETMRREGFELAISRPEVIIKEVNGEKQEPYEFLTVDVEDRHQGAIMEQLGSRKGELKDFFAKTQISPDTTKNTLGKAFTRVDGPMLLASSKTLLDTHLKKKDPIDRDSQPKGNCHKGRRCRQNPCLHCSDEA